MGSFGIWTTQSESMKLSTPKLGVLLGTIPVKKNKDFDDLISISFYIFFFEIIFRMYKCK